MSVIYKRNCDVKITFHENTRLYTVDFYHIPTGFLVAVLKISEQEARDLALLLSLSIGVV